MAAHATMAAPAAVATTSCATALLSSPHSRRRPSRKLAAGASISFDGNAFVNRNAGMVRVQAADGATGWVPCSSVSLQCEAVRRAKTGLSSQTARAASAKNGPVRCSSCSSQIHNVRRRLTARNQRFSVAR